MKFRREGFKQFSFFLFAFLQALFQVAMFRAVVLLLLSQVQTSALVLAWAQA